MMMRRTTMILMAGLLCAPAMLNADEGKEAPVIPPAVTPSAKGASVYLIGVKDGKTLKSKNGEVLLRFGLKGMGIAPAGVYFENTGHHHLLIDMDVSEIPAGTPIPTIEGKAVHFGKGQTEAKVKLAPGKHTLQLVLGNYSHLLHEPAVASKKITVTVE